MLAISLLGIGLALVALVQWVPSFFFILIGGKRGCVRESVVG